MDLDVKQSLLSQLDWHWQAQLRPRLEGLTDEEYLWEPAPRCWSVRPGTDGRWRMDGAWPPPEPPPPTTIAWRMAHLTDVLGARASHHFGDRSYRGSEIDRPSTAAGALEAVDRAYAEWKAGVEAFEDLGAHSEGPPGTLDAQFPFTDVILHINREAIHHGAEIALLRDLYRVTRPRDPFVTAVLAADRETVAEMVSTDPGLVQRISADHPDLILQAVQDSNPDAVRLLAGLGFDVNAMLTRSPLHAAAGMGDLAMVELLLELGADSTMEDPNWKATPLGWAEYFNRSDVIKRLAEPSS